MRSDAQQREVPVTTLDTAVSIERTIGLLKIDVEGHELKVLKGAQRLLASGLIRDIVFEDFDVPPKPTASLLESYGYVIYRIGNTLFGPTLGPVAASDADPMNSTNFLATRTPKRALARLAKRGWAVLSTALPS